MAANAAKKRRPEEEVEEEMHLAFRGAANALSQVYTHAVAHQKASFLAGERRAMENVYRWLSSQHEEASEVPVAAVLTYLQNEIEHRTEETLASPQHPGPQPACNFPAANDHCNPFSFGNIAAALDSRMDETDQTRNAGISNALPCPLQQNFHSNHLSQSSGYCPMNSLPNGNGPQNNHLSENQDFVHYNSIDAAVDMHYDGQWR
ncbi:hypothetical protein SEVIR_5G126901v4 [Setaria viridis]|uniref:Holocarboxylase synthetase n=2 Tax=Setaria TaxID=4554 RepID=A0A368R4G0_SETIT|nr:uncharacterized protein LOC101767070 isoform X1 [Setaria italica]XP_034596611.1 uncharacterized protein LOC117857840 isoform X1 [Setaria viridis]RCV24974.1 hypothetical protein SETIT_5G129400v2 [Setaria italica]TKW13832.1 hypothetical protein SEVIR_5G126901v2 [Setaria viridis]